MAALGAVGPKAAASLPDRVQGCPADQHCVQGTIEVNPREAVELASLLELHSSADH